jgi:hypothetical protein
MCTAVARLRRGAACCARSSSTQPRRPAATRFSWRRARFVNPEGIHPKGIHPERIREGPALLISRSSSAVGAAEVSLARKSWE